MAGGYEGIPMRRGSLVEEDMFGHVEQAQSYEQLVKFLENHRTNQEQLFRDVRRRQPPGNPFEPTHPFSRDLRAAVLQMLGITNPTDFRRAALFTAVGSPLDAKGVDAFFDIFDDRKQLHTVTMDVTLRDKADELRPVDIVIWAPERGVDEKGTGYSSMVREVAEMVVQKVSGNPGKLLANLRTH